MVDYIVLVLVLELLFVYYLIIVLIFNMFVCYEVVIYLDKIINWFFFCLNLNFVYFIKSILMLWLLILMYVKKCLNCYYGYCF